MEGKSLAADLVVIKEHCVGDAPEGRLLLRSGHFDLLLFRSVVIQAPERLAAGIVVSAEGQVLKAPVSINFNFSLLQLSAIAKHKTADVVVEGPVLRQRRLRQLG